ncbi:MAG: PrgI family protein [Pseudomonadales bacterium]|nr:PrgI family protein [Pseudomonadales bacterium]
MQEHTIPQDITGYRFHIIGSMTLKQFGEIFLSVIVAVIIYNTNLSAIIKWPLIFLSVGIGATAAFVPIEERPLDHWIATLVRIMYKPTKFFWKREASIPEAFLYQSLKSTIIQEPELDLSVAKHQRISEYLGSIPERSSFSADYSQDEIIKMQNILSSFESVNISSPVTKSIKQIAKKPNLDVRVRSLRIPKNIDDVKVFESQEDFSEPESMFEPRKKHTIDQKGMKKAVLSSDQVAQNIDVPQEGTVKLISKEEEIERVVAGQSGSDLSEKTFIQNQKRVVDNLNATKDVSFNSSLPFPIKPTKPNKLVGMVLSKTNDLLTDSIVEVQTLDGGIERAVKTNALGQFYITTPLRAGEYKVVVEKDHYIFEPMHITINDTIIQPIEIRSEN